MKLRNILIIYLTRRAGALLVTPSIAAFSTQNFPRPISNRLPRSNNVEEVEVEVYPKREYIWSKLKTYVRDMECGVDYDCEESQHVRRPPPTTPTTPRSSRRWSDGGVEAELTLGIVFALQGKQPLLTPSLIPV